MQIVILLVVLVVGALLAYSRLAARRRKSAGPRYREKRAGFAVHNPFHAVSILPAEQRCAAVEQIEVRRFLSDDAPGLPLSQCSLAVCQCIYKHYADRRDGARDRRLGLQIAPDAVEFWRLRNRRMVAGRRQIDPQGA